MPDREWDGTRYRWLTPEESEIKAAKRRVAELERRQKMAIYETPLPMRTIIEPDGQQHNEPVIDKCTKCGINPAATQERIEDGKKAFYYDKGQGYDGYRPICESCRRRISDEEDYDQGR